MSLRRFSPLLLLSAALLGAAPLAAQTLPPQPPEETGQMSAFDQARANWLTECTWNQSSGRRSRAEAREYCEAYLANRTGYSAPRPQVEMTDPVVEGGGGSVYSAPSGPRPAYKTRARRLSSPGQERQEAAWRARCEAMLRP